MMPRSCAPSSASAICRAISRTSSIGSAPDDFAFVRRKFFRKRVAFDELHHEGATVDSALTGARLESVHVCDVWMIERGQDMSFALESRQPLGVAGKHVGQDFDRDVPVQP